MIIAGRTLRHLGAACKVSGWLLVVCASAAAQSGTARFWNLTGETIVHLSLAPAGSGKWGPDQCRNDPDGSVDFDERLRITGVTTGLYDVKFVDKTGKSCSVSGVEVKTGSVFSIGKEALDHCSGP